MIFENPTAIKPGAQPTLGHFLKRGALACILAAVIPGPALALLPGSSKPTLAEMPGDAPATEGLKLEELGSISENGETPELRDCLKSLLSKNYEQAILQADALLKKQPEFIAVHEVKAAALVKQGKVEEGMQVLENALRFAPKPARVVRKMGDTYLLLEQFDQAETAFKRALDLDPSDTLPHQRLGYLYERAGKIDQAVSSYLLGLKDTAAGYLGVNVNLGRLYNRLGRYQDAIQLLQNAVSAESRVALAHTVLGSAYLGLGQSTEAIRELELARKLDSGNIENATALAMAYQRDAQPEQARKEVERIVALKPEWPGGYRLLGDLEVAQGHADRAIASFEKAAGLSPDPVSDKVRISQLLISLQRTDEALAILKQLQKESGSSLTVLDALSALYFSNQQLKEAESTLMEACTAFPTQPLPFYKLGLLFTKTGRHEASLPHFLKALEIAPNDDNILQSVAFTLAQLDRKAEAIGYAERSVKANPANPDNKTFLAVLCRESGDSSRAAALYREVLTKFPDSVSAQNNLAVILSETGQHEEAIRIAGKMLAQSADMEPNLKVSLAAIFYDAGSKQRSRELYEEILAKYPENVPTLNNLALLLAESGEFSRALQLAQKACQLMPEEGKTIDTLGWVYFLQGNFNEAGRYLERALKLQPDDPSVLYHLGMVFEKIGLKQEAEKFFGKALASAQPFPEREKVLGMKKRISGGSTQ